MSELPVRDLEIPEDQAFERLSWTVQRVGWAAMAMFVLAASAGLLGAGPLSTGSVQAADGFRVEYTRFARYQDPEALRVAVPPHAASDDIVRLWVNRDFLDGSTVSSITPAPVRVEGAKERVYYLFDVAEPSETLHVAFSIQAERVGRLTARLGVANGSEVTFTQLVYP